MDRAYLDFGTRVETFGTTHVTHKRLSWYGHAMRREDTNVAKASNNNEGGREETSKPQTEVDGQNAERFQTPA